MNINAPLFVNFLYNFDFTVYNLEFNFYNLEHCKM